MRISDWSSDVVLFRSERRRSRHPRPDGDSRRDQLHGQAWPRPDLSCAQQVARGPAWAGPDEPQQRHAARNRLHRIDRGARRRDKSEEHTSELQSLMRISYAVFCLKKKNTNTKHIDILLITTT